MEYDRLPLIDDWSAEFVKILSVSVLEHGVILVGMVTGNDSELEHTNGLKYFCLIIIFVVQKINVKISQKDYILIFKREFN